MEVYNACVNNLIADFTTDYQFLLPSDFLSTETVIVSSAEYVEAPFDGCS
jgi:hypothetical protein